jgi:hypothetical protein
MIISGEIQITYPVYRRLSLSFLGYHARLGQLFALFLLGASAWTVVTGHAAVRSIASALFGLGLLAIPELFALLAWQVARKRATGLTRYQVGSSGMIVEGPAGRERLEWTDVARVRRGRHAWSIQKDGKLSAILVPKTAFAPDDRRIINDFFLANPEFAG